MKYIGNDFYCDIVLKNKIELNKEYESENVIAFHHTNPSYPLHIIVIPKKHIASFITLSYEDNEIIMEIIKVLKEISKEIEIKYGGARIITNLGKYQESKHLHFHITSGEVYKGKI